MSHLSHFLSSILLAFGETGFALDYWSQVQNSRKSVRRDKLIVTERWRKYGLALSFPALQNDLKYLR